MASSMTSTSSQGPQMANLNQQQTLHLTTPLNIDPGLQHHHNLQNLHHGHHHQHQQQQQSPNYQQPSPWTISEANSHCVHVFDRLRVQREQSRFADLILSVRGREFAAHRCVLAACSPWFDARLKVHKSTREHIAIDQCKDYEIFYALLTYCYTGNIVLDQHNVSELLSLSVLFQMVKLKSYCCEYLCRNLNAKNVHTAVDLAIRHSLSDLIRRSFSYLQRNFPFLYENDREELMQYSPQLLQTFLTEKGWSLPAELVLKYCSSWVNYDLASREEYFANLLYFINWNVINPAMICEHLDEDQLYHNSQEALFSILSVLDRNNIYLGQKYHDLYLSLQERILPEQELDELNDSNSFLSMAINSAVKDLEHSEVDTDFFLHNDPFRPSENQHNQQSNSSHPGPSGLMGPPPPPPPLHTMPLPGPPVLPSSSSILQQPIQSQHHNSYSMISASTTHSTPSISSTPAPTTTSSKVEKMEKFKDSFEFEIVEQLINEQQQSEDKTKYPSVKRYDPKYRALTEAFRQMDQQEDTQSQAKDYPHPKQRHLSNNEYKVSSDEQWNTNTVNEEPKEINSESPVQSPPESILPDDAPPSSPTPPPAEPPPASPSPPTPNPMTVQNPCKEIEIKKEFPIETKKKLASKERRANALAMMEENANAILHGKIIRQETQVQSAQKLHVRKAKLLAEHRETLKKIDEATLKTGEEIMSPNNNEDENDTCLVMALPPETQSSQGTPSTGHASVKNVKIKKEKKKQSHCPICGFGARSKIELNKHLSQEHLLQPPFRCTHTACNFETTRLQSLLKHADTHTNDTLFHCPSQDCNFTTTTMHRMKFHKILHTGKVLQCDKCDKKFTHRSSLATHQLVHETIKKFHCPQCTFSTKYKNHLSTHMRIHRGDVLKCSVDPNCSYSTPKKSLMKAHERAHKKERLFKCDQCDKAFVENSALTRHKRIHSDELPFACDVCTFKTRRRDKLKHHLLKKHTIT